MKNMVTISINGFDVTIKAKQDDNPSGWAVIAFTPSCSIRCMRTHRENLLQWFCDAVAAACDSFEEEDAEAVRAAVIKLVEGGAQ